MSADQDIDLVDLGIMWDRLQAITDEILFSIVRTSFSVGVREAWDLACIIFDPEGRSIAQATLSMPAFIGTAPATMQHMLDRYPAAEWRPGDVVVTNDPWLGTGHTPDICIARPAFSGGALVGFVMTISHLPDIGGAGISVTNKSIYEEGLILPVCKLYVGGEPDATLHALIGRNVRVPDQVFGDLLADVSGCIVGERLIGEFMAEYGLTGLSTLADGIIARSERAARERIADIPDGVYRNTVQVEGMDGAVTLACAVTIKGDSAHVDFEGTGPTVPFAVNVPLCYTSAFATYTMKCLTTPSIPNNQGAVLPVSVSAPEGCILNARRPSPTGGRHSVGWFVVPLIMGALADAVPDRVQSEAGMASLFIVHSTTAEGRANATQFFLAGGLGAMKGLDGQHCTPFPTNNAVVASEVWEDETGVRIKCRRLLADSGGYGEFRGGLGQHVEMTNASPRPVTVFTFGMRTEFAAQGYRGGGAGAARRILMNGEPIAPKGRLELAPSDTLTFFEAGGGGYGDPFARDPERVLADVEDGAVSVEAARRDYGVAVDLEVGTAIRVN